jgi:hypothetical protein
LKYPLFPWAQNFQDGAHQTTGAQRKIFEKGTIFFGHPVLGGSIQTIKENTEALVVASKKTGLEVNADTAKYIVMSRDQNAG